MTSRPQEISSWQGNQITTDHPFKKKKKMLGVNIYIYIFIYLVHILLQSTIKFVDLCEINGGLHKYNS
jgi:hypothetical protein